jgi:hypothetical protein
MTPCTRCNRGFMCELHMKLPFQHDGCEGFPLRRDSKECEWWLGWPNVRPPAITMLPHFVPPDDEPKH